jgi:hypothetical protein
MLGIDVDDVAAGLLACSAGLSAGGPCIPGVRTVDTTGVSVAVLFAGLKIAGFATMFYFHNDLPATNGDTTATQFRTSGPPIPFAKDTINGAWLCLAITFL